MVFGLLLTVWQPINRELSLALLEAVNRRIDLAEDGIQAIVLAEKNAYDLILINVQMPNLNGLDATRMIHPGYPVTQTRPYQQRRPMLSTKTTAPASMPE